jgi:hypothetical protein
MGDMVGDMGDMGDMGDIGGEEPAASDVRRPPLLAAE